MKKALFILFTVLLITAASVLVFLPYKKVSAPKLKTLPYSEEEYTLLLKQGDEGFEKMHLHGWRQAVTAYFTAYRMKQSEPLRDRLFMALALTAIREKYERIPAASCYDILDRLKMKEAGLNPKQQYLYPLLQHYRKAPFPDETNRRIVSPYKDYVNPAHFKIKESPLDLYLFLYLLQYYTFEPGQYDQRLYRLYHDLDIKELLEKYKDHPLMIYYDLQHSVARAKEIEARHPSFAEFFHYRANHIFRFRRNNLAGAFKYYKKAYKLIPDYTGAINGIANIYYFTVKNYERAVEYYEKTLLLEPGNPVALFGKGVSLHHMEQYAASNRVLEYMLENQDKYHGEAYYYKGYNYFMTDQPDLARAMLEKAKHLLPGSGEVHALSGQLYQKQEEPGAAEMDYLKALEDNNLPAALVLYNLGAMHLKIKNWLFFDYFDRSTAAFKRQLNTMKEEIENIDSLDVSQKIKQWMKHDRSKKYFDFNQQAGYLMRKMQQISQLNKKNRPKENLELIRNRPTNDGNNPLHMAAVSGDVDRLNRLLAEGVFIDVRNKKGHTPLYYAVMMGKTEAARTLVQRGADVNVRMPSGYTPLHEAAYGGHKEIVELLLKKGAEVYAADRIGQRPVHLIRDKYPELASVLSPLHRKVKGNYLEAAKSFLQKHNRPGLINIQDHNGQTPLYLAVKGQHLEMARRLLEQGADPNCRDHLGLTPFYYAKTAKDKEMQLLLATKGAKHSDADHLKLPLKKNQKALLWYAHRNVWVVRTANHALLFNFLPTQEYNRHQDDRSLFFGRDINSFPFRRLETVHCLSHNPIWHSNIQGLYYWGGSVPGMVFVTGWDAPTPAGYIKDRVKQMQTWPGHNFNVNNINIHTVKTAKGTAAFWLKTDNLTLFYASNHFLGKDESMTKWLEENYDPIKEWGLIDIAILPIHGSAAHPQTQNALQFLETVQPNQMFPLYAGTAEHYYNQFSKAAKNHQRFNY
jgi:ankyrin repeat protein/Tfp pilus assembly protein PilF